MSSLLDDSQLCQVKLKPPLEFGVKFLMQNPIDYSSHLSLPIAGYCKNIMDVCSSTHGAGLGDPTSKIIQIVTWLMVRSYHIHTQKKDIIFDLWLLSFKHIPLLQLITFLIAKSAHCTLKCIGDLSCREFNVFFSLAFECVHTDSYSLCSRDFTHTRKCG